MTIKPQYIPIPDPQTGVASVSVASTWLQPGGHVLNEDDIPGMLKSGTPAHEITHLQLASPERFREILVEERTHTS